MAVFCFCFFLFNSATSANGQPVDNGDGTWTTSPETISDPGEVSKIATSQCGAYEDTSYVEYQPMVDNGRVVMIFGPCVNTFAVSMAINSALKDSGISIDAVNYSWKYANGCLILVLVPAQRLTDALLI